jgi:hypothetical protein
MYEEKVIYEIDNKKYKNSLYEEVLSRYLNQELQHTNKV